MGERNTRRLKEAQRVESVWRQQRELQEKDNKGEVIATRWWSEEQPAKEDWRCPKTVKPHAAWELNQATVLHVQSNNNSVWVHHCKCPLFTLHTIHFLHKCVLFSLSYSWHWIAILPHFIVGGTGLHNFLWFGFNVLFEFFLFNYFCRESFTLNNSSHSLRLQGCSVLFYLRWTGSSQVIDSFKPVIAVTFTVILICAKAVLSD